MLYSTAKQTFPMRFKGVKNRGYLKDATDDLQGDLQAVDLLDDAAAAENPVIAPYREMTFLTQEGRLLQERQTG
jgi:hypothetical protein